MILDQMATLADITRARLLGVLEGHELAVAELCEVLGLPQSTVSRHLKVLGDDGWLVARAEGTSRRYRMAEGLPAAERQLWSLVREQMAGDRLAARDGARLRRLISGHRDQARAFFASAAGRWDAMRTELFGHALEGMALAALLDERWRVADLGCGTGRLVAALAPHVAEVVGIDASREMLAAARRATADLRNVTLREGDLEALPLPSRSLDAAVLGLALPYVADPARTITEAARVLVAGGRLVVLDLLPHDRDAFRREMGHQWLGFAPAQVQHWFQEAGLVGGRVVPLPADPEATGPALFAATARTPKES